MSLQPEPTPFSGGEWARRLELVESGSVLMFLMASFVAVVYGGVLFFQYSIQFLLLFLAAVILSAVSLVARTLARRGYITLASYMLLVVMLLILTGASLLVEGIVLIAATFYVAVIAMAGILLGARAGFTVAGLSAVLYVVVAVLSHRPFIATLTLDEGWFIALTSFISALTFLFVAYLGWLTTRDLRRALRSATFELVKANEELQEANRLKTRFLARISHELRTPLNAIIGFTDMNLVGVYGELNEAQRDSLERVQRNSRQLLNLINDVLDLSRIQAEELELSEGIVSPKGLVLSVITTVQPRADEKGLTLSYEATSDLPPKLLGDEVRLNQVLLNLVDNAIKFTDEGNVHVTAQLGEEGTWILQVRDTGRGISEQEKTYIFDEFRQGEIALRRESGGTGLGLAIVRGLVEAMGGSISVQSRLGAGSTFTVTLPMNPAPESMEAAIS